MQITAIIPFRGNPATLAWVLEGFSSQQLPPEIHLEVRIGADGFAAPATPPNSPNIQFTTLSFPWCGVSEAKNRLLQNLRSDIIIFGNADTRPDPHFAARHAARLLSLPAGSLLLGAAPYVPAPQPTCFDALLNQTPMIFFYSQMQPRQWYDFRHAWTLNLSVRHADLLRAGGFDDRLRPYGHEDIAFAHRLMGDANRVYFDPDIIVHHHHPMTFADYLNREEALGLMAPVLHDVAPEVFQKLFGTQSLDSLAADYRTWVQMDLPTHRWIWHRMNEWITLPCDTLPSGSVPDHRTLMALYQMHIPLKRLAFRLGFLHGLTLRDDADWQSRRPAALWKSALKLP